MVRIFTIFLVAFMFNTSISLAQGSDRSDRENELRRLPGNATLSTGSIGRTVVELDTDIDTSRVIYRTLFDNDRTVRPQLRNSITQKKFVSECGDTGSISKRNECIGDIIRERRQTIRTND